MSIEELKKQRQQVQPPKKSQGIYVVLVLIGTFLLYEFYLKDIEQSWVLFVGLTVGYMIQRSKFCFSASIRDVLLFRKTKVFRAVILGMIVATIGFGFKQLVVSAQNLPMIGQISSVGLNTVIGGILFGIGMVIAGGCVTSVFTRIGEGYLLQWVTLIGIFIGTGLYIGTFDIWFKLFFEHAKEVYLGDYIPLPILIVLQVIALGLLFKWAYRFEKRRK